MPREYGDKFRKIGSIGKIQKDGKWTTIERTWVKKLYSLTLIRNGEFKKWTKIEREKKFVIKFLTNLRITKFKSLFLSINEIEHENFIRT